MACWGKAAADTREVTGGTEETGIGHRVARHMEFETAEVVQVHNVTVTEMTEEGLPQLAQQTQEVAALEGRVVLDLTGDIVDIKRAFVDGAGAVEFALGIGGLHQFIFEHGVLFFVIIAIVVF